MAPKYARKAFDEALAASNITDTMVAVGLFSPKGTVAGMTAGGLVGDIVGGGVGGAVGSLVGDVAGLTTGRQAAGSMHNLPSDLILGVSTTMVYGATQPGFGGSPSRIIFQVPREGLKATAKNRLSVRVLELEAPGDPVPIRLEGNRNPLTGSKDVIQALTS